VACLSLYLHGQLLSGQQGPVQRVLIGAVFFDLVHKDLHLGLEDHIFLLGAGQIAGHLVKEIIDGAHVVTAENGFFKRLVPDILRSHHILFPPFAAVYYLPACQKYNSLFSGSLPSPIISTL